MSLESLNQKRLRAIAGMLPPMSYETRETQSIKGEDLLLSGHKEVEGKPIEAEREYFMRVPVYNEANHYRRLKRAFQANGREGVKAYLRVFVSDSAKLGETIDLIFPEDENILKKLGVRAKA